MHEGVHHWRHEILGEYQPKSNPTQKPQLRDNVAVWRSLNSITIIQPCRMAIGATGRQDMYRDSLAHNNGRLLLAGGRLPALEGGAQKPVTPCCADSACRLADTRRSAHRQRARVPKGELGRLHRAVLGAVTSQCPKCSAHCTGSPACRCPSLSPAIRAERHSLWVAGTPVTRGRRIPLRVQLQLQPPGEGPAFRL